jgi:hypothetical protein
MDVIGNKMKNKTHGKKKHHHKKGNYYMMQWETAICNINDSELPICYSVDSTTCGIKLYVLNNWPSAISLTSVTKSRLQLNLKQNATSLLQNKIYHNCGKLGEKKGGEELTNLMEKLSPCSECCILSFGWLPGVWLLCADISQHSVSSIFIGGVTGIFLLTPHTKMEQLECSETSAY